MFPLSLSFLITIKCTLTTSIRYKNLLCLAYFLFHNPQLFMHDFIALLLLISKWKCFSFSSCSICESAFHNIERNLLFFSLKNDDEEKKLFIVLCDVETFFFFHGGMLKSTNVPFMQA